MEIFPSKVVASRGRILRNLISKQALIRANRLEQYEISSCAAFLLIRFTRVCKIKVRIEFNLVTLPKLTLRFYWDKLRFQN